MKSKWVLFFNAVRNTDFLDKNNFLHQYIFLKDLNNLLIKIKPSKTLAENGSILLNLVEIFSEHKINRRNYKSSSTILDYLKY